MPTLPDIRCRACGELRPYHDIDVKQIVEIYMGVELHQNYQYCSDNAECTAKAAEFDSYFPNEETDGKDQEAPV